MIITGLINLAYYFINFVVGFFPTSEGFPSEVSDAVNGLGGYLNILDPLIPVDTLVTTVGLLFVFELIVFGFKTVKWLISHIPQVGGRG